jgi:hypothetical protein
VRQYVTIYAGLVGDMNPKPVVSNEPVDLEEKDDLMVAVGQIMADVRNNYPLPQHEYRIAIRLMPFID